ncbi:peptide-methionine (S)-S-oxide reductase [Pedobacter sp. AW31-3R]|uniref:peptide-methionine (S)-S-oxide reductase n=1 Tax=Pedobacter sp. AW31-3R TaxID=3445781 RepID=UPI003F9FA7B7
MEKIGFGGSCHWCTEAIFLSLKGVTTVEQGWVASSADPSRFSEAVLVEFDPQIIPMKILIAVHLHTHSSTSDHSMRDKYRSAVYTMDREQQAQAVGMVQDSQQDFEAPLITEVLRLGSFKLNTPEYLNYYFADPDKPFCRNVVNPKLQQLLKDFSAVVNLDKLAHLR